MNNARIDIRASGLFYLLFKQGTDKCLRQRGTRQFYYAVIVDDYLLEIKDKESLLEALYYQAKLITVHNLNWDAIQEGLEDSLNNFIDFEGICLLFKNGNKLKSKLSEEFQILSEILSDINKQNQKKQVKILMSDN